MSSGDQHSILKCASSLGRFFSSGEMGQKRDLTDAEKAKIVKSLSEGCSTLEISKILGRDHETIKRFVANSKQGCNKHVKKKRRK